MASGSKNNTIDISIFFDSNGLSKVSGDIQKFNKIVNNATGALQNFKDVQDAMNDSRLSNAKNLSATAKSVGGQKKYRSMINTERKRAEAEKTSAEAKFMGTQEFLDKTVAETEKTLADAAKKTADADAQNLINAFHQTAEYMANRLAKLQKEAVELDYFNNLSDTEKESYASIKLQEKIDLAKKRKYEALRLEEEYLKKPMDDSFSESLKFGFRRFEQQGRSMQGLGGFASRFLGNAAKGTRFGDVFAAKDPSGAKISGTGINLGLAAIPTAGVAIAALTKGIKELGTASMTAYGDIEAVKTQLGVIYGSKGEANSVFNEIAQYAVKSPFSVQSTAEYATLLKQSGVYSKDLMETLKMIGDVTGGNEEKMKRVANNYAQVIAQTRATSRDLREFAMAGIPIYQELANTLGKSVAEVKQMGQEGKISGDIIQKTFKRMTGEGGIFEGAIAEGAKTYKARKINTEDIKQLALAEIGQAYFEPMINPLLELKAGFFTMLKNGLLVVNKKKDKEDAEAIESLYNLYFSNPEKYKYISEDKKNQKKMEENFAAAEAYYDALLAPEKDKLENLKIAAELFSEARDLVGMGEYIKFGDANGHRLSQNELDVYKSILPKKEFEKLQSFNNSNSLLEGYVKDLEERLNKQGKKLDETEKKIDERTMGNVYQSRGLAISTYQKEYFDEISKSKEKLPYETEVKKTLSGMAEDVINAYKKTALFQMKAEAEKLQYFEQIAKDMEIAVLSNSPSKMIKRIRTNSDDNEEAAIELRKYIMATPFEITKANAADAPKNLQTLSDNMSMLSSFFGNDKDFLALSSFLSKQNFEKFKKFGDLNKFYQNLINKYKSDETMTYFVNLLFSDLQVAKSKLEELKTVISEETPLSFSERFLMSNFDVSKDEIIRNRTLKGKQVDQNFTTFFESFRDFKLPKEFIGSMSESLFAEIGKSFNKSFLADRQGFSVGNKGITLSQYQSMYTNNLGKLDWRQTAANMERFALSLESSIDVTDSYIKAIENQTNKISSIIQNAYISTDDAAEIAKLLIQRNKDLRGKQLNSQLQSAIETAAYNMSKEGGDSLALEKLTDSVKTNFGDVKHLLTEWYQENIHQLEIANEVKTRKEEIEKTEKAFNTPYYTTAGFGGEKGYLVDRSMLVSSMGALFPIAIKETGETLAQRLSMKMLGKGDSAYGFAEGGGYGSRKQDDQNLVETIFSLYSKDSKNKDDKVLSPVQQLQMDVSKGLGEKGAIVTALKENTLAVQGLYGGASNLTSKNSSNEKTDNNATTEDISDESSLNISNFKKLLESNYDEYVKNERNALFERLSGNKTNFADKWMNYRNRGLSQDYLTQGLSVIDAKEELKKEIDFREKRLSDFQGLSFGEQVKTLTHLKGEKKDYQAEYDKLSSPQKLNETDSSYEKRLQRADEYLRKIEEIETAIKEFESGEVDVADATIDIAHAIDAAQTSYTEMMALAKENARVWVDLKNNMRNTFKDSSIKFFTSSFEEIGKSIYKTAVGLETWEESGKNLAKIWADVGKEMLSSIGTGLVQAGIQFIANNPNWAGLGVGLALIGAGGMAGILSGVLGAASEESDKDKEKDDETQRLQTLKDLLSDLIDQAKTDAEYYQRNYLHKRALQENEAISVNDAVITPRGDVIKTSPEDYIFATKTPANLASGNAAPNVNITFVNQSGESVKVGRVEKKTDPYGNVDIKAIIVATTAEAIADGTMDGAFSAMSARHNGYSVAY